MLTDAVHPQMQGNRGGRPDQHNHGPGRQQQNLQHDRKSLGSDSNGQHMDGGEQSSPSKNLLAAPSESRFHTIPYIETSTLSVVSVASQMLV